MNNEETMQTTDNEQAVDTPEPIQGEGTDEQAVAEPSIEQQLADAQAKAQEYLDGWQRSRAEFANYKRRVERELQDSRQNASLDLLVKLFPILSDFERAMSTVPENLKADTWLEGVTLIQRKFQKLLEENGVEEIDPTGEVFDPNFQEAVGTDEDTSMQSGCVTATLQKGYRIGDRVLRPALVRVAR